MSGEYCGTQEPVKHFFKGYEDAVNANEKGDSVSSRSHSTRLYDIEEQLEMAENRCITLTDQLDHMKNLYGLKNKTKIRKISNIITTEMPDGELSVSSSVSEEDKTFHYPKQTSNSVSSDTTGAAVKTINNILNGITNSVNRLSELHVQISESPRMKRGASTLTSPMPVTQAIAVQASAKPNEPPQSSTELTTELELAHGSSLADNGIRLSNKSKNLKKKNRGLKLTNRKPAGQGFTKPIKIDKRTRSMCSKISNLERNNTVSLSKSKLVKTCLPDNPSEHLVEIYHNVAAKNSDSDDGRPTRNKRSQLTVVQKHIGETERHSGDMQSTPENVPPLNILNPMKNEPYPHVPEVKPEVIVSLPAKTSRATTYEPPDAPRTVSCYSKNYELPTIASRLKQVAKCYLNTFNFKAIPFCAAISTSPSHNIGINIQQVMNILKNRQPISGISPTLAHNIGLAAERLNSRPLSVLVSSMHSRSSYKVSNCPLSKTFLNYQQLQDMAKSIPEEIPIDIEEGSESPQIKTVVITGPSGEVEVKNRNIPIWAIDPHRSEQCTCIPPAGVDFQHVMNKYKKPLTAVPSNMYPSSERNWKPLKKCSRRVVQKKSTLTDTNIERQVQNDSSDHPLQGKEKNLKEVLMNLHNEFEDLNKRYEDLSQFTAEDDEMNLKELEEIEKELNKKEEEITMVMTLYKEVLALKQQVKVLKQKQSEASIATKEVVNYSNYNNPRAALHLTKLLKQIQMYQTRYKKSGVEV